jgi:5-methylcytosine-specific restriction endonuclease McrA
MSTPYLLNFPVEHIKLVNEFFDLFAGFSDAHRTAIIDALIKADRIAQLAAEDGFYDSDEWKRVRYTALKKNDGRCQCCGRRPSNGNPLHVDHIKPRSLFPALALAPTNLQVLCADCNYGKSNLDQTDWR